MRDARTPGKILENLDVWADTVTNLLNSPNGAAALDTVFRYITLVTEPQTFRQLGKRLGEFNREAGEKMQTMAEFQLAKGEQAGREQGERMALLKLFQLKFGKPTPTEEQRIREASTDQLSTWLERTLTAHSPEEFWA